MKYTLEIDKYDEDWGIVTFEKDGNKLAFIVQKDVNWNIEAFSYGKVGKTKYRKDRYTPTLYEKDGRGRESKIDRELMKELYSEARDMINYGEVK